MLQQPLQKTTLQILAGYGMPLCSSNVQLVPKRQCFISFSRFLGGGEAALAANLITAWKILRGGCTSSQFDHGYF